MYVYRLHLLYRLRSCFLLKLSAAGRQPAPRYPALGGVAGVLDNNGVQAEDRQYHLPRVQSLQELLQYVLLQGARFFIVYGCLSQIIR